MHSIDKKGEKNLCKIKNSTMQDWLHWICWMDAKTVQHIIILILLKMKTFFYFCAHDSRPSALPT